MKKTPIKFGNTTLDVQPYSPLLESDGNITSLDVNGLPKQLTDDILDMHLSSIARPGKSNLLHPSDERGRLSLNVSLTFVRSIKKLASLLNSDLEGQRSCGGVVDNTLVYQFGGHKIDPPLLWVVG